MKTRHLIHSLILLFFCISLCNCNNEKGDELTNDDEINSTISCNTTELYFDYSGGIATVNLIIEEKAREKYGLKTYFLQNSTWCRAQLSDAKDNEVTLSIVVSLNEDYENRNDSLIIVCGESTHCIEINQSQENVLILSEKQFDVDKEGGIISVEIETNISYDVEIADNAKNWISQISTRGLSRHSLDFEITENKTLEKRVGEVYIKTNGYGTKTITITQAAGELSLTINVERAGTFSSLIASSKREKVSQLTVTGYLNGSDIGYIRAMAGCEYTPTNGYNPGGNLRVLDISNAHIVSGGLAYAYGQRDDGQYDSSQKYYTEDNTITPYMFTNCANLKKLVLPNDVTKIDKNVFNIGIESITLPKQLQVFNAEIKCYLLKEISIDEKNSYFTIKNGVLYSKNMTTLICNPAQNEKIKDRFFVPNGVRIIAPYAFWWQEYLNSIILPQSIEKIGLNAFSGCVIDSLTIKPNIEYSKLGACTIDNIIIEDGFDSFNGSILEEVSSSTIKIYCKIPPKGGIYNKKLQDNCRLLVPKGSYDAYNIAYDWGDFKYIEEFSE